MKISCDKKSETTQDVASYLTARSVHAVLLVPDGTGRTAKGGRMTFSVEAPKNRVARVALGSRSDSNCDRRSEKGNARGLRDRGLDSDRIVQHFGSERVLLP